jgi:aryl-alcohol dehydrogenase-like predicted oxidoreductase
MDSTGLNRRSFLKTAAAATVSAALGGKPGDWAKAAESFGEIPKRTLGRTGLKVTMMGIGGHHADLPEKEEDTIAIIHRALELGINFFDNADCYNQGRAEERMGKALEGHRQNIVLMTKVDQRDAEGARATLEKSLRHLSTDYLDIWQFHAVSLMNALERILGPGGALEAAEKAKKEGKIRFIGLTGHFNPEIHLQAVQRYPFDTIQMPINVMDPHFRSFRKTVVDEARKRNTGILAMKTLCYGNVVSKGVAKAGEALRWVWSQPIDVLVSGCDRIEVLDYNVYLAKTFTLMSESEQAALLERTAPYRGPQMEVYKDNSWA